MKVIPVRTPDSATGETNSDNPANALNPFESPLNSSINPEVIVPTDHMMWRGLILILVSGAVFGLFGLLIGWAMGEFIPQYFRGMFRHAASSSGSIPAFGAGIGLVQGIIAGLIIGCVVFASVAWYKSRMRSSLAAMIAEAQALQSTLPGEPPSQ